MSTIATSTARVGEQEGDVRNEIALIDRMTNDVVRSARDDPRVGRHEAEAATSVSYRRITSNTPTADASAVRNVGRETRHVGRAQHRRGGDRYGRHDRGDDDRSTIRAGGAQRENDHERLADEHSRPVMWPFA